jgi:hypothetical protein
LPKLHHATPPNTQHCGLHQPAQDAQDSAQAFSPKLIWNAHRATKPKGDGLMSLSKTSLQHPFLSSQTKIIVFNRNNQYQVPAIPLTYSLFNPSASKTPAYFNKSLEKNSTRLSEVIERPPPNVGKSS